MTRGVQITYYEDMPDEAYVFWVGMYLNQRDEAFYQQAKLVEPHASASIVDSYRPLLKAAHEEGYVSR